MKLRLLAIIAAVMIIAIILFMQFRDRPVDETGRCSGESCNRTVYIDSSCALTTGSRGTGDAVSRLDVLVGTRVCLFNESGCPVEVVFDTELFDGAPTTLATGACVRLVVDARARGKTYTLMIKCQCVEGEGHTNPEVKVGDGDEDPLDFRRSESPGTHPPTWWVGLPASNATFTRAGRSRCPMPGGRSNSPWPARCPGG